MGEVHSIYSGQVIDLETYDSVADFERSMLGEQLVLIMVREDLGTLKDARQALFAESTFETDPAS
jgi:hypothetical protein